MKKIVTVVGARPQFIKAAAVSQAFRSVPELQEVLVHTGQHYDENMSDVFFGELDLAQPRHHLGVGSGRHGSQTGRLLEAIEKVLISEEPNWVLVYGDTNSTLAGALAAVKLHFPVAHIEAGLRSFNRRMPEEINRILVDHCSSLLFAPTKTAVDNLYREGVEPARVHLSGDVMYDVALRYGKKADNCSQVLETLGVIPKGYVLATIHRAENTDDPGRLRAIFQGLECVAAELPVVVPLHPRTRSALQQLGWLSAAAGLIVMDPVGFLDMILLEKNAKIVVTDSGGVQKEAFFYHVPCVTLRDETEWVELVELGWNKLVNPTTAQNISNGILTSLDTWGKEGEPYGSGQAAQHIVMAIINSMVADKCGFEAGGA